MVEERRYQDLSIVSAKIPADTHSWFEVNSDGSFYFIATGALTHLYYSADKMDTEAIIDIDPGNMWGGDTNHRPVLISSAFHDEPNKIIYFCDIGGGNIIYAWKLDYSASESVPTVTEMGSIAVGTVSSADIFIGLGDPYIWWSDADEITVSKWVDPNWVDQDSNATAGALVIRAVTVGSLSYMLSDETGVNRMVLLEYDISGASLSELIVFAGTSFPSFSNQFGITYDGSNILNFVLNLDADGKNYLYSYNISDVSQSQEGEFNVALQMNRNNRATIPNELEKGFGMTNEIVYEIKARKGGIVQLQDISTLTDANIIAITDNFLMNSDGDMFEWTNVSNKTYDFVYNGGIFPTRKVGTFKTHPDDSIYFNEKDSLKIYDDSNVLEVWAKILKKYKGDDGIPRYDIDFFSNELLRTTHNESFSANDTADKQKAIIDALDICYRSSSIVATTTNYSYVYARIAMYMYDLARFMERQVGYTEPDAKVWTKAYDGLTKAAQHYPDSVDFKNDTVGSTPSGWTDDSAGTTSATIITSLDGHRNILQLDDQDAGNVADIHRTITQGLDTIIEFWATKDSIAANTVGIFQLFEGVTIIIQLRFQDNDLDNFILAYASIKNNFLITNTLTHFKLVLDDTANTFDCYIDDVLEGADLGYRNNSTSGVNKVRAVTDSGDSGYKFFVDGIGVSANPTYMVGDNVVAWTLNDGNQDVILIDIPGLGLDRGGYFNGSLGVTRNTVRYKNNATSTKPTIPASGKTATELLTGIVEGKEFSDAKLEASTEADQLATNRFDIFSSTIQYIGIRIKGEGFLLEGKTLYLESTDQLTIAAKNFLILSYRRDPINDETFMILTDNIIFPEEFTSFGDTNRVKLQSANIQAFENQADITNIPPVIHQILMVGENGFVKSSYYGAMYGVIFSNTTAAVRSTFYVGNGGSFKVSIIHSGTGNNFGKTAGGVINISYDVDGGLETWNIGTQDFNLPLEDIRYLKIEQFGTAFTVANNSKVGIFWSKDDNAGGAAGIFNIYGMFLTRQ